MEKRLIIEGMSCGHCTARVEKALGRLEGVSAKVDLQGAHVTLGQPIPDEILIRQVEEAGYTVTDIHTLV